MAKMMVLKRRGMLGYDKDAGDIQEIRILNRLLRLAHDEEGVPQLEREADPRHAQIVTKQLGLLRPAGAKSIGTTGNREKNEEESPLLKATDVR
eukprot:10591300-Heterocapsa_arctica.AAC.1